MASQLVNIYNDILNSIKYHLECSKTALDIPNDIKICDERSFEGWYNDCTLDPTTIYVIVSFNEGDIWFGNTVVPIDLTVYSEEEKYEITRQLLTYFATTFNFVSGSGTNSATYIQSYEVPTMREEFVKCGTNYRAIFDLAGTFVYGENVSGISELYIDNEKITFLNIECNITMTPSSANLGNLNERTTTKNKCATFTLTLSIPSVLNSNIVSKLDGILFGNTNINSVFNVRIKKGGIWYPTNSTDSRALKVVDIDFSQEITGIPMYSIGFGE